MLPKAALFVSVGCPIRVTTTCGIKINNNEVHLLQDPKCKKGSSIIYRAFKMRSSRSVHVDCAPNMFTFGALKIKFVGYIVGSDRIKADPEK